MRYFREIAYWFIIVSWLIFTIIHTVNFLAFDVMPNNFQVMAYLAFTILLGGSLLSKQIEP